MLRLLRNTGFSLYLQISLTPYGLKSVLHFPNTGFSLYLQISLTPYGLKSVLHFPNTGFSLYLPSATPPNKAPQAPQIKSVASPSSQTLNTAKNLFSPLFVKAHATTKVSPNFQTESSSVRGYIR